MSKYKKIFLDGVIFSNPTFVLVLGTCPTLGLISSAMSAMSMGLCIIVILTLSNVLISAMRKVIPNEVRIPCYIVLIATLVTLLRMVLEKFLPDIYSALGGFLALIVVNCIILGRAEAFANKHTVPEAAMDGLANGIMRDPGLRLPLRRKALGFQHRPLLAAGGFLHHLRPLHCTLYQGDGQRHGECQKKAAGRGSTQTV